MGAVKQGIDGKSCIVINVKVKSGSVSRSVVSDSAIPWTVACQAPLSMEFSRKNTGVGCHFLLQRIFPRDQTWVSCIRRQLLYHLKQEFG